MLNQGCPRWGWNARRQATHCVAPQRKPSTTALTARTWPQRILVAFMATEDQGVIEPTSQARITARRVLGKWSERIGLFICRVSTQSWPDASAPSVGRVA